MENELEWTTVDWVRNYAALNELILLYDIHSGQNVNERLSNPYTTQTKEVQKLLKKMRAMFEETKPDEVKASTHGL
jgi:hypothetical protein